MSPDVVYLIENVDDPGALLALDARVANGYLQWHDTSRHRMVAATSVSETGSVITVQTERGTYSLQPLTLTLYRAKVQATVAGQPHFLSDEDVQGFYRAFMR